MREASLPAPCKAEMQAVGLPFDVFKLISPATWPGNTPAVCNTQRAPHGKPKIVPCPRGRIVGRGGRHARDSATYRRWLGWLNPQHENGDCALYLPEGVPHGFLNPSQPEAHR